tara:strand:+ start:1290 stop:1520 length:231 start_codon:yes stop_codon:yes gene_type:complete
MLLSEYLNENGLTYADFASQVGFSVRSVEKWSRGERYCGWKATDRISKATNQLVTAEDHYNAVKRRNAADSISAIC